MELFCQELHLFLPKVVLSMLTSLPLLPLLLPLLPSALGCCLMTVCRQAPS
jgi:hypothetical protein